MRAIYHERRLPRGREMTFPMKHYAWLDYADLSYKIVIRVMKSNI